jgi:tetratricopeptide (TPR) repeat protein
VNAKSQDGSLEQAIIHIQAQIEAGELEAANDSINKALKLRPGDGGVLNLRGVVHAQRGQIAGARRDFHSAVEASPNLVSAWKNLGRACQMEAKDVPPDLACAVTAWERVARATPTDSEAAARLLELYWQKGDYPASLREWPRVDPAGQSQTANLLVRAEDLAAAGRWEEAEQAVNELARRPDFAPDVSRLGAGDANQTARFKIVVVNAVGSLRALKTAELKELALAYEQLKDWKNARSTLERAAGQDPNNPAHLLELARIAELMKDHEGALGYLAHARDLSPKDAQIHYLFARVASEIELPIEAKKSLERALAIEPNNPHYNYAMGYVILSTRDAASAASYFQKYVDAFPKNATGHYALGIAYFTSGDYASAKKEMKSVQNSDKAAGADYFLGRIARMEGDLGEAEALLHESISAMPDFAPSHTELARVWMAQNKVPDAEKELDRAIQIDRNNFLANEQLLIIYKRRHDPRAQQQSELLKKLDEERSKRADLMLRTIEFKP